MRKISSVLIIVLVIAFSGIVNAQKMGAGVQVGVGLPMGDFGDACKTGFGGSGTFLYSLNPELSLTGSIGYYTFTYKNWSDASFSTVPVLVGARYALGKGSFAPYIGAELGFHFCSYQTKASTSQVMGITYEMPSLSGNSTDFGFAPIIGFLMPISPKVNLDVNLKYNIISTSGSSSSFLGINAGVQMGL